MGKAPYACCNLTNFSHEHMCKRGNARALAGGVRGLALFCTVAPSENTAYVYQKKQHMKKSPFYSIHDSFSVRFIPNFFFKSVFLPRKKFWQKFLDKKNCAHLSTLIVEAWVPHPVFCFIYIPKKVFLYKVFCFYVKTSKMKIIDNFSIKFWFISTLGGN